MSPFDGLKPGVGTWVPTIKVATIESAKATWTAETARISVSATATRMENGPGAEVFFVTREHLRLFSAFGYLSLDRRKPATSAGPSLGFRTSWTPVLVRKKEGK